MTAPAARFVCQACGASHPKWIGRCDACGAWNTIIEEAPREAAPGGLKPGRGRRLDLTTLDGRFEQPARRATGIVELDRVFGGGLVPGSAVLLGGDPGIGKSTLALQAAAGLARGDAVCVYLSGEEAVEQVRMRAERLGLADTGVLLAAATNLRDILTSLEGPPGVDFVVVDSIQTVYLDTLDSAPGTVAQVRAGAHELVRFAKRHGAVVLLVGHVTKEGVLAGPRVVEHMVDTVLYFEGERGHQFRILRAVKNRFGATDEIGVFEMSERGLLEVNNPSKLFLSERKGDVSGAAVFAGIEGSRPMLVEVQGLVAPSPLGTPRRAVVGWDTGRLAMVLAVLDARCGLAMGGNEVYLNVAGGLRITEPAADLAVAAALVSSLTAVPVPADTVVFGEIGLSGEVRAVSRTEARLREAAKLGFARALAPKSGGTRGSRAGRPLKVEGIARLRDLVDHFRRPH
ncbi:MAG: DNA repair protein RadA [Alphaproteobacteria bacterium]